MNLDNISIYQQTSIVVILLMLGICPFISAQTTITLTAIKDNQINNSTTTNNAGTCNSLDSYNSGTVRRALFKFDLSSIPAGATITSATFNAYTYFIATTNTPVRAHRLTADWDEGGVCGATGTSNWNQRLASPATNWTTAGGDYDPTASASITTSGTTAGTYGFNLTALTQAWVNGTYANHGVVLLNDAGYLGVSWRSREWTTTAQQPQLVVTYTSTTVTKSVAASSDDAEEAVAATSEVSAGYTYVTSSDLEMTRDAEPGPLLNNQYIGMRFTGINIPQGAIITSAYLTFRAVPPDYTMSNSEATSLTIRGQIAANASTFTTAAGNISSRAKTAASVAWTPTTWISGMNYNSPSIVSLVQEIVNQGAWASGNAMAFIVNGTGHRSAASYDGDPANAPRITITYTIGTTASLSPIADTEIYEGQPTTNWGTCPDNDIGGNTNDRDRSFFKFDLSSIPAGAVISSATLTLVKSGASNTATNISAYRTTGDWDEGNSCGTNEATNWNQRKNGTPWTTPGGDYAPVAYATTSVAGNGTYNWTVTNLVKEWYNGTYPNYGFLMRYTDETVNSYKSFYHREHSVAAQRPVLTITYTIDGIAVSGTATNITCRGASTGAINITALGNRAPYTYNWLGSNGFASTSEDISNLSAGTYTVTVTGTTNGGGTATASFTVAQPTALTLNLAVTSNYSSGGSNGAVNLSVSGGTAPYTYAWKGPNGFTAMTEDVSGLPSGIYNVTVTDGCSVLPNPAATASAVAVIGVSGIAQKQLYLTDPAQGLDRTNPADPAAADNTTASTATLSSTTSYNLTDDFGSGGYTGGGSTGLGSWTGSWVENDAAGGGAASGNCFVNQNEMYLYLRNVSDYIYRDFNLASAASPVTLTFTLEKIGLINDQTGVLEYSSNGGGSYSTLLILDKNTVSGEKSFVLSSYSANCRIRFRVTSIVVGQTNDFIMLDNFIVSYAFVPNPTTTFTQGTAMCSNFVMPAAGAVSVSTYLAVTNGSMPTNPNITAVLKYGSTTFATLTNPSYNSTTGLLTWTGALAAATTIPAGQAVSLQITTSQPFVEFSIDYDSQTKPSNISLPTSTAIKIESFGIYNAAYSGGSPISNAPVGNTVYARATVSDPFGFADITGLTLKITDPTGSTSTVTATSVATSGCNRIYEYAWTTPGTTGGYTLAATAKEGSENTVSAVQSLNFTLIPNSSVTVVNKYLYLKDALGLDRTNPAASPVDNTTALTSTLSAGTAAVVVDAVSSTSSLTLSTITLPHTTGTNDNRLLLVGISLRDRTVLSVTYGGTALALVGTQANGTSNNISIYRLLAPPSGTANVVITLSGAPNKGAVIGAMTFSGVDQTTPLGTFTSASGSSSAPSVAVASASGELVFDVVSAKNPGTLTVGAGQTQRWNILSGEIIGGTSTKPGAASTTMSWALGASTTWSVGGVSIKPAAVVSTLTFTENPVLCSNLTIKSGNTITVSNYVSIISGSMPASPNITAVLKYGAVTVATLTNPAYNATTGLLTWTTTLGTDVTVPAGSAIVLQITTVQSGVAFQIRYDSQTYPSKITLPVSTFINVISVQVYGRSYPNGSVITNVPNAGTSYIRIAVSDPFGTSDITGVNLILTKPDNSVINVTLGSAHVVKTSGCVKTYQYTWANPGALGDWNIQAIGNEGSEGVTHSLSTTATVALPTGAVVQNKHLYLSDPAQVLDRIDPVNTADATTATTASLTVGGTETIAVDAASSGSTTGSSVTVSHTTGTGTNRLMLVGVSMRPQDNETVSSVTYGGTALTQVGTIANGANAQIYIYRLINPASGTANLVVTANENVQRGMVVGVTTFTGAHQTMPLGTFVSASGSSTAPSVSATSAAGELVFDVVAARNANTLAVGSGQTQRWNVDSGAEAFGGGSTEAGAASVAMSWTSGSSGAWAVGAVPIKPASTTPNLTTTFTESPALCSNLLIKSGQNITVTTYLSNITGTMPASPSITALLKYGSTNIISLASPAYNSGTSTLTWVGTLGADVTVPAGQAIALQITTAQSGVSFQIDYDSQAKPSKIELPVTTYVDIASLAMYDAAYPGGSVITNVNNGSTVYLRATVTDPFGTSDITSMDISILNPAGGTSTVSATSVATSGCTRTYQYVWNSPAAPGDYYFTATAKEGYENLVVDFEYLDFSLCPITVVGTVSVLPTCILPGSGEIELTVTNGGEPYTWNWTRASSSSTGSGTTISGLIAGTYNITVISGGGCMDTTAVVVPVATGPGLTVSVVNESCFGNDGTIDLTASGTSGAYYFSWNDGSNSEDRAGLDAAIYIVTATDAENGCSSILSVPLTSNQIVAPAYLSDIRCNGESNGIINIFPSGGSGIFTYMWSDAATTEDRNGLVAGLYALTISDDGSCTGVSSYSLSQPAVLTASRTFVEPTCTASGTIDLNLAGGTMPYNFDWADVPGNANINSRSGLAGGTFSVTVTDANGCTVANTTTLAPPDCDPAGFWVCQPDFASVFSTDPDPFVDTYVWSVPPGAVIVSGQGTPSIVVNWTGVSVQSGQICVRTTNICGESADICQTVYIRELNVGAAVVQPTCTGGTLQLLGSGGVSYQWSGVNGFTSGSESPLIYNANMAHSGVYTVTVTDEYGCSGTAKVIASVSPIPTATAIVTPAACGLATGAINLTAANGTAPYNFLWSSRATTEDLTGLTAGAYSVTVTDIIGCTASMTVGLSNSGGALVTPMVTNTTCNGTATGSISLSVSGGTAPFSYLWSNGRTTQNISNLTAGMYLVFVNDAAGCQSIASPVVSQPSPMQVDFLQTNAACNPANGAATGAINLILSGATPGYTFDWADVAGTNNSEDRTGLAAGLYTVTVRDANACTSVQTFSVSQPAALVLSAVLTNVSCNGAVDGIINLSVSGGTTPYFYLWSDGNVTEDIFGKSAGTYSVTITDAAGCTASQSFVLTAPAGLLLIASITNVACNGTATGAINLTVSGGTGPKTFAWSNGETTEDILAKSAATYIVTVTDGRGCIATSSFSILQPNAQIASVTAMDASCNGTATGTVNLTVSGGTGAKTYAWSSGETTEDISGKTAGTYAVTITDANGCTVQANATVAQPATISIAGAVTNVLCNGAATGAINITAAGGSGALIYDWADLAGANNMEDRINLPFGNYSIRVTDAAGCSSSQNFTVGQPANLALITALTNPSCNSATNGAINLTVSGGMPPYAFSWSNGATTEDLNGLTAGIFSVTATDGNGCMATTNATLTPPDALILSFAPTNVNCKGEATGAINLTVAGGTSPHAFLWSSGETMEDIVGKIAGSFNVTVTDFNGCTAGGSATVSEPATALSHSAALTNVACTGGATGAINLTVLGGTPPEMFLWSSGETTEDITGKTAGSFTVTISDASSCTTTAIFSITQPLALAIALSKTDVSCSGGTNGSIDLTATGGTFPLTYLWSNSSTATDLGSVATGNYTVTATDANGCTTTASITVAQPPALVLTSMSQQATACGLTDGSIDLAVSGGTAPFNYAWSNGMATQDLINLPTGVYTVTVTDANGCLVVLSNINVNEASTLSLSAVVLPNIFCPGTTNGSIDLTVSGGTAPFNYAWSNGAATEDLTGLAAGTYTVAVADANNCVHWLSLTITEPIGTPIVLSTTSSAPSCGLSNGTIDLTAMGGTMPYTYLWSNGATTQDLSALSAGVYNVTITDINGCSRTQNIMLPASGAPMVTATPTDARCWGDSNGSIALNVSGGIPPYTYWWSTGATTASLTNCPAGAYSITVSSAGGCAAFASATVEEPAILSLSLSKFDPSCYLNDGSALASSSGGTAPISFLWSNAWTGNTTSGLAPGNVSLTATDANGCTAAASATLNAPVSTPVAVNDAFVIVTSTPLLESVATNDLNLPTDITDWNFELIGSIPSTTGRLVMDAYGNIQFTPAVGFIGSFSIPYQTECSTANLSIQVNAPLSVQLMVSAKPCPGQNGGAINATAFGGIAPFSYIWSNGMTTEDLSGISSGNYAVTVSDASGTTATAVAMVTAWPVPDCSITGANAVCPASSGIIFTGSAGMAVYAWSVIAGNAFISGATNTQTVNVTAGTNDFTLQLTVTDANGCTAVCTKAVTIYAIPVATITNTGPFCVGQTLQLTANGGDVYDWNGPNGFDFHAAQVVISGVTSAGAGTYNVVVTNAATGCTAITSTNAIVNPPPQNVMATAGVLTCSQSVASLTGSSTTPGVSFQWSGPAGFSAAVATTTTTIAGTYNLVVTAIASGCSASASAAVTANSGVPTVSLPSAVRNCLNSSPPLQPTFSPSNVTFQWSGPNGFTSTLETPISASLGTYSVTVTNPSNGCTAVAAAVVTESFELPFVTASGGTISCSAPNIQLLATASSSNLDFYWTGPGGFASNTQNPIVYQQGVYYLRAKSRTNGCFSIQVSVSVDVE